MKVLRVYVDTSVIGGCCDPEFAVWSNSLLKDFEMGFYKPVISEIVTAEIADAPDEIVEKLNQLLDCEPEFVDLTAEAAELAEMYLAREILPATFSDDARHVACATMAGVDVLVSWNFKHIVNLRRMRAFNAINIEMGYRPIDILSPREVTSHEVQNG